MLVPSLFLENNAFHVSKKSYKTTALNLKILTSSKKFTILKRCKRDVECLNSSRDANVDLNHMSTAGLSLLVEECKKTYPGTLHITAVNIGGNIFFCKQAN